jgi:hypothetical protein
MSNYRRRQYNAPSDTSTVNVLSCDSFGSNIVTWIFDTPITTIGDFSQYVYNGNAGISARIVAGHLVVTYTGAQASGALWSVNVAPGSLFFGGETLIVPQMGGGGGS